MGSPVFVKKGVGRLWRSRKALFFRRSQAWPFWADPSLRTIFLVKNIRCYRRYIGRISLPPTKPVLPLIEPLSAALQQPVQQAAEPRRAGSCRTP
jgi:hypothetical protein